MQKERGKYTKFRFVKWLSIVCIESRFLTQQNINDIFWKTYVYKKCIQLHITENDTDWRQDRKHAQVFI